MQFSHLNISRLGRLSYKTICKMTMYKMVYGANYLTASEIKLNLCGADPNASGLLAYWKMNEGSGSKFKNSSSAGTKYDMDWAEKVFWDNAGNGTLVQADKSAFAPRQMML